jgi:hypothetical protein
LRRRIILAVIPLAAMIVAVRLLMVDRDFDTAVTAQSFDTLRDDHPAFRAFLYRMPKGGDLHVHLSVTRCHRWVGSPQRNVTNPHFVL